MQRGAVLALGLALILALATVSAHAGCHDDEVTGKPCWMSWQRYYADEQARVMRERPGIGIDLGADADGGRGAGSGRRRGK